MAAQTIVIDIVANFVNKTNAGMNSAKQSVDRFNQSLDKSNRMMDKLGGKNARPKVSVVDRATSTLNKIDSGLKAIGGKTFRAGVKIIDYATKPLQMIKNTLFSVKGLVAAIGTGLALNQVIAKPISIADAYSSAKIGFSNLLGETEGQKMMDDLDLFAKKTPFNTSGVIQNAQMMMAMGWEAKDILKDMETIGNAAAATGKGTQGLEAIVRALSQIKTKGKLSTEELNQLSEQGISAKAMLAEQLGYGTGDKGIAAMSKDLEKGLIGSEQAIQALLEGMKQFDGMMDKTANETVDGLKSQIEDAFEINILRKWGQGLQDGAKRGLGSVLELLDSSEETLGKIGDTVYDIGKDLSNWAADKLEGTIDKILKVTDSAAFKNADTFGKVKILWDEVIAKPFGSWWDSTGQAWFEEKAKAATKSIAGAIVDVAGETLNLGFNALLNSGPLGKTIAAGLAFKVAQGVMNGISSVKTFWYGTGEAAGNGGLTLAGMGLKGVIGSTGNAMVNGSGILGKLASLGYTATGFSPTAGMYFGNMTGAMSGGKAAFLGGLTALGAVGGTLGTLNSLEDLTRTLAASSKNDQRLYGTRAATKGGMVALGAGIGTLIAPGLGTAVGAGLGGLATFLAGNKLADAISGVSKSTKELNKEAEELAQKQMAERFGDITLSAEQLATRVSQVFGAETISRVNKFNSSMSELNSIYSTISGYRDTIGYTHERIMGKETLSDSDIENYKSALSSYADATKELIKANKTSGQSAFQLLWGKDDKGLQSVTESMNKTYTELEKQLSEKSKNLNEVIGKAFSDGKITIDEEKKINEIVQQIEKIQNKIEERLRKKQQYASEAAYDILTDNYSDKKLTAESFQKLLSELDAQGAVDMKAYDDARIEAKAELELQYDGKKKDEQYYKILNEIEDKWRNGKAITVKQKVNVSMEVLKTNYSSEFAGIEKALKDGNYYGSSSLSKLKMKTTDYSRYSGNKTVWNKSSKIEFESLRDSFLEGAGVSKADQKELAALYESLKPQEEDLNELKESYMEAGKKVPEWIEESLADISNIKLMSGDMNSFYEIIGEQIAKDDPAYAKSLQEAKEKGEKIPQALIDGIEEGLKGDVTVEKTAKVAVTSETSGEEAAADKSKGEVKSALDQRFGTSISENGKVQINSVSISGAAAAISSAWETFKSWVKEKFSIGVSVTSSVRVNQRMGTTDNSKETPKANGGYVDRAITALIGEAGPEMIIPLSANRRQRGKALWERAGRAMGLLDNAIPNANGGLYGVGSSRLPSISDSIQGTAGAQRTNGNGTVSVNVGGVNITIQSSGQGVQQDISQNADDIAGQIADILQKAFQNMPIPAGT